MWFDAGVNLTNQRLLTDVSGVLARAQAAGVTQQLLIATNEQESQQAIELCERFPGQLYTTVGVHPHEASGVSRQFCDKLANMARHPAVVAIGECGLDFNRNYSPPEQQIDVFSEQIKLANELRLPLYLHERDALDTQLAILEQFCAPSTPCLTHCFTGGPAAAEAYQKRGHWFGLTGWLCDERRNQELLDSLSLLPRDKVLIETDAPFLVPRNIRPRPKFNEPALLPYVGKKLAEYWQLSESEVATLTRQNAESLLLSSGQSS